MLMTLTYTKQSNVARCYRTMTLAFFFVSVSDKRNRPYTASWSLSFDQIVVLYPSGLRSTCHIRRPAGDARQVCSLKCY